MGAELTEKELQEARADARAQRQAQGLPCTLEDGQAIERLSRIAGDVAEGNTRQGKGQPS